jgi:hypothetical protein
MTYTITPHKRGDTWDGISSISFNVNGVPINLTNANVAIEFRQNMDYPVALRLEVGDGIEIVNPSTGTIRILPRIIQMPPGKYLYDLQIVFSDGTIKTYMSGSWEILPDITE